MRRLWKPCLYHRLDNALDEFGTLMVISGAETLYEIDGKNSVGQSGLGTLAAMDTGTSIIVKGKMKANPCRFEASEVYAGTGVPGSDSDYMTGSILSRDGNTLTVNGMIFIRSDNRMIMNDTAVVTISEETLVSLPRLGDEKTIDDLAPGQHVTISGDITMNEILTPEMDATQGLVRMNRTVLRGTVTENPESSYFTFNLDTISMRPVDYFDFLGTGLYPATDADPSSYEVETGDLDITSFATDTFIKIFGFTNAFGQAPYDFQATSLVSFDDFLSFIKLRWVPSTTETFSNISDQALVVDLDETSLFQHLGRCGILVSLENFETPPTIKPAEAVTYVIMVKNQPKVYTDFTEFVSGLNTFLDGKNRARSLFASGTYSADTTTLVAEYLTLHLRWLNQYVKVIPLQPR
jgi:hypothetical protein